MRRELHRVDSLNQKGIPLDTVSCMKDVLNYFDKWGNSNERMMANYLYGCVFRDQKNIPLALRYYRNAVSFADTTDPNCDYLRLSRIYGQIAELFHYQRVPQLEIEAELKAVKYSWKAKDTLSAIIFYGYLADSYHMQNQMDSALWYNQETIRQFKEYGRQDYAAGFLTTAIDIYLRKGNLKQAKQAMDDYEQHSGFFSANGEILSGKEFYYNYKGLYYESVGMVDSAEFFYRKLLLNHPDFNRREAAYKGLLSLYKHTHNGDSIAKYAQLFCLVNDSASLTHSADEIVRNQALYDYEEHDRIATQKAKEAGRYQILVISLIVITLIIIILIYIYVKQQKKNRKKELQDANKAYTTLLTQFNQAQQELYMAQRGLNNYQAEKEKEIKVLQKQLEMLIGGSTFVERWNIEQTMMNSTIIRTLHQLASHVVLPTSNQWQDFRQFVKDNLPAFVLHLESTKELTYQEILICMLTRLSFIPTEIAALLGVSKQRITNIRAHINTLLFNEKSSKTFDTNIMKL